MGSSSARHPEAAQWSRMDKLRGTQVLAPDSRVGPIGELDAGLCGSPIAALLLITRCKTSISSQGFCTHISAWKRLFSAHALGA